MIRKIILFVTGVLFPVFGLCQQAVEINQVRNGDEVEVRAKNPNPFQVTAEISLSVDNLTLNGSRRISVLLNPYNNRVIKRLKILDRSVSWNIGTEVRTTAGNIFSPVDEDFLYQLPFENNQKYRLEQGYNGRVTHRGFGRYALDFSMPEGTPVHAVRKGVVAGLRADSDRRGLEQIYESEGNFVMVLHEDGSIAVYAHLQKGGVEVDVGQRVRQGDRVGYSGNTGYSRAPHLHFMVGRFNMSGTFTSFPVKLMTDQGVLSELETGKAYSSPAEEVHHED